MVTFRRENRPTIRRRIGSLMGVMEYGTNLESAQTGRVALDLIKRRPDNAPQFVGALAYIASGTGAGQARYITSTSQSAGTGTISAAWTTAPDTTSVIELWNGGFLPEQVNDQINLAILDAQEVIRVPVRVNATALSSTGRQVTFPSTLVYVSGIVVEDANTGLTTEYPVVFPGSTDRYAYGAVVHGLNLIVTPTISTSTLLANIWIKGYRLPALLEDESTLCDVRSDFVVYHAAAMLEAGQAAGPQLDPEEHGSRAGNWLRMALGIRTQMITPLDPNTVEVGP